MSLTVGQLREAIANLPDDMPVEMEDPEGPWFTPSLYISKAHRDRRYSWSITEGHVDTTHPSFRNRENLTVLLVSRFGHDDAVDITPKEQP